jgi:hypothetical protein
MPAQHEQPFFEIGIYRCSQHDFIAQYERDRAKYIDEVKAEWKQHNADVLADILPQRQQMFWKEYGTAWGYNQAVAWLRLVILGSSIRGQLWKTDAKRFQRIMRRQQIYLCGATALEVSCFPHQSSDDIHRP